MKSEPVRTRRAAAVLWLALGLAALHGCRSPDRGAPSAQEPPAEPPSPAEAVSPPDGPWRDGMNRSLLRAAAEGRARAVSELLAAGADPDAGAGWLESTPLHLAAEGGHLEVVKTLVRAVADTDALDELGLTPQDAARIEGQWRVERYLRRAGDR